jgi:hypothetical protein
MDGQFTPAKEGHCHWLFYCNVKLDGIRLNNEEAEIGD